MAQPPRIAASMKREALLSSALFRSMRPVGSIKSSALRLSAAFRAAPP
jgi:hypothetical protein